MSRANGKLTIKQRAFVEYYLQSWNATRAAERAGYKNPNNLGPRQLTLPLVKEEIEKHLQENQIKANEIITRLGQMAQANAADFFIFEDETDKNGELRRKMTGINWENVQKYGYLIKKISYSRQGVPILEFHDPQMALDRLGKNLGLFNGDGQGLASNNRLTLSGLPADLLAPDFISPYRDIVRHLHTEYLFDGGRGSTKSSFVSEVIIYLMVNNPTMHALAMRQVGNTLRDSVYAQLVWAINELGLSEEFSCTTSPLEIKYKPTGQTIYFRGADDAGKVKSIKPKFGYIGILWLEELDQFHGAEAVRKIEQSAIRGGDLAYIFKSWNPPRTANNWANKYRQIPKASQYQHHSTYLTVPKEWLGKAFLDEAEHLKQVNPVAYEHEYLGVSNGTGGLVFENVRLEKITDEQIAQFDHILPGLDWGYYPDPANFGLCHFDAARRILYIFGELRRWKTDNKKLYEEITLKFGLAPGDLIIADSAEPKSVGDFQKYSTEGFEYTGADGKTVTIFGPNCKGAEKGPDSVDYSMKWLQGLTAIVIDPERCPYAAEEFVGYELEQDKDGNFISAYPDHDNHSIDQTRYATNLIWRKRGK